MNKVNLSLKSSSTASTIETQRNSETELPDILPLEEILKAGFSEVDKNRKGCGFGWTPLENKRYSEFLSQNQSLFCLSLEERKKVAIHSQMSQAIKSRTSLQCRSHHQKMLKKYGSIENIVTLLLTYPQEEKEANMNERGMKDLTYFEESVCSSIWNEVIEVDQNIDQFLF